jgi:hypothetical protein
VRSEPGPEEVTAGQLLAHLVDGVAVPDAGEVSGRHDLDFVLADGTVVAVEVTSYAVDCTRQTQGEVSKRRRDYPELTRHWWLSMEQPAGITWAPWSRTRLRCTRPV